MIGWPYGWRHSDKLEHRRFIRKLPLSTILFFIIHYDVFITSHGLSLVVDALRDTQAARLAVLIPKNVQQFPENTEKLKGTIDVWWIVRILLNTQPLPPSLYPQ